MPLERVQQVIESFSDLRIILFKDSTHTAELASQALGVTTNQIAKSLLFIADGKPLLVVACGGKRIDAKLLLKQLNAKKIKFADAITVETITGFSPGGVSPLGLLRIVPIYLDISLFEYKIVYIAAGTANSALPISPQRLQQITNAEVINVCYV